MDKRLKKLIAGATSVALVASQTLIGFAYGAAYPQVVQDAFNWAKQNGMTNANSIDEFEPYAQLSRGTAAKLFAIFGKDVLGLQPDVTRSCNFSDIDGKWYAKYAIEACQLGLMKGDNGKFYGDRKLFKSEAVVVLARALAGKTLEWNEAITYAQEKGITHETDVTKLYRPVLKWELVIMEKRVADQKQAVQQNQEQNQQEENTDIGNLLNNLLNEGQEQQQEEQTNEQTTSEENQQEQQTEEQGQTEEQSQEEEQGQQASVEGNVLEVALDPESPNGISLPYATYHQTVMVVDFTAGSKDVKVNYLKFKRIGVWKAEDFDELALYVGGRRISDWKVVNSYDDTLEFSNVDLLVKAGTTVKVELVANIADNKNVANHQDGFKLLEVNADANVKGLPIVWGLFNIIDVDLTPAEYSILTVPSDVVRVGDDAVVMRFRLQAPTDDAVHVKYITLVNNWSVDAENLVDFRLEVEGKEIARASEMYTVRGDDLVTFKVNDYVIWKGASRIFTVKAKIAGGKSAETIKFDIDDMFLQSDTYSVGVKYIKQSWEPKTIQIRASKLVITKIPLVTSENEDYRVQIGANDVVLWKWKFNAGHSDLYIKGLRLRIVLSGASICKDDTPLFNNIRLYDATNDRVLLTTSINCSNVNGNIFETNFSNGAFVLKKWTTDLQLLVNIPVARSDANDSTVQVDIVNPKNWEYIKDLTLWKKFQDSDFEDVVPNTDLYWDKVTLKLPKITIEPIVIEKKKMVAGGEYVIAGYKVKLEEVGKVDLYSPQFKILVSKSPFVGTYAKNIFTEVKLYVNDEEKGVDSPNSEWVVTYEGKLGSLAVNWKGDTDELTIKLVGKLTSNTQELGGIKGILATIDYIEFDDNYGNAYSTQTNTEVLNLTPGILSNQVEGKEISDIMISYPAIASTLLFTGGSIVSSGDIRISVNNTDDEFQYKFALADGSTVNKAFKVSLSPWYEDFKLTKIVVGVSVDNKSSNKVCDYEVVLNGSKDLSDKNITLITWTNSTWENLFTGVKVSPVVKTVTFYGVKCADYKTGDVKFTGEILYRWLNVDGNVTYTWAKVYDKAELRKNVFVVSLSGEKLYTGTLLIDYSNAPSDTRVELSWFALLETGVTFTNDWIQVVSIKKVREYYKGNNNVVKKIVFVDNNGSEVASATVGANGIASIRLNEIIKDGDTKDYYVWFVTLDWRDSEGVVNKKIKLSIKSIEAIGIQTNRKKEQSYSSLDSNVYTTAVWYPSSVSLAADYDGTKLFTIKVTNGGKRTILLSGFTIRFQSAASGVKLNGGVAIYDGSTKVFSTANNINVTSGGNEVYIPVVSGKLVKLDAGDEKTFVVKVNWGVAYDNSQDDVKINITIKRDNGIKFDDGDTNDKYRATGLKGINMKDDSVSVQIDVK